MNEPNFYLSESTLISIRQILWYLEKKETEKKYRTTNFELMLILVLGGYLKEEAVIEVRRSEYGNVKYKKFHLGKLGKRKKQIFKPSELKENFSLLCEKKIAYSKPLTSTLLRSEQGFFNFKDYQILLSRKKKKNKHDEDVDANWWLEFSFDIKYIKHELLKNFFQKYLKNFENNKLLNSDDVVEDIFKLFGYEIKYEQQSNIIDTIDSVSVKGASYKLRKLFYFKSEQSILATKKILKNLEEKLGGHIVISINPKDLFKDENEDILLNEIENIKVFKKIRLFESIFYLEYIKKMYNIEEMDFCDKEWILFLALEEPKHKNIIDKYNIKLVKEKGVVFLKYKNGRVKLGREKDSKVPQIMERIIDGDGSVLLEELIEDFVNPDYRDNPDRCFKNLDDFIRTKVNQKLKSTPFKVQIKREELKTASENEDDKSKKIEIITVRLTLKS
jgi:hypothetical protein